MRTSTIVVDGLSALQGGGQTYLRNLFTHAPDVVGHSVRVIAVVPNLGTFRCGDRIECLSPSFSTRNVGARLLWTRTELPALLKRVDASVLFCPSGSVSAFGDGWKTAVTFQNMLPFDIDERRRYPYGYMRARLAGLQHVQARSFKRANLVIFLSDYARSVIDIVVGARTGQSIVIPHGPNEVSETPENSNTLNLPDKYVAYVSILDVYKAQLEVVEAWALMRRARQCSEKLLLVGPCDTPYANKVRRLIATLGLQAEVILTGNIAHELLPAIYGHALANIFASSCENCPNILLEALASGRPVLCSDYQPMPELAGSASLYFDPYTPQTLTNQLCRVLDDDALRNELARASRERAAGFQGTASAEQTWQALFGLTDGRSEVSDTCAA